MTKFFLCLDFLLTYCFGEDYSCLVSDFDYLFGEEKDDHYE
jgi:hypothetical protein